VQNSNQVIIKFVATSAGFGTNNIYMDDINIVDTPLKVEEENNTGLKYVNLMPNPAKDITSLNIFLSFEQDVQLNIVDLFRKFFTHSI
jgi:hypothetical protein